MRRLFCALVCALLPICAAQAQVVAPELLKPENRTISSSKQFTVFGGTRPQRSDLVRRAEQLREKLNGELNLGGSWRAPVLLTLTPHDGLRLRQPRLFAQVFDAGEAGRKLQLDISPSVLSDRQAIDDAIIRSLLLEIAVRRQKFSGNRFVEPPGWLVSAMTAALSDREPSEEARIFSALLETKSMPKLERFLRQDPASLRGRARDIHEAQSLALYRCLLELPDGRGKIVDNLTLKEPVQDPLERFSQTWPELSGDPDRLARIWALGIARLASPSRVEFLSADETAAGLARALRSLDLPSPGEEAVAKLAADSKTEQGTIPVGKSCGGSAQSGPASTPAVCRTGGGVCRASGQSFPREKARLGSQVHRVRRPSRCLGRAIVGDHRLPQLVPSQRGAGSTLGHRQKPGRIAQDSQRCAEALSRLGRTARLVSWFAAGLNPGDGPFRMLTYDRFRVFRG